MPYRPSTPCKHPWCNKLVPYGRKYCEVHAPMHTDDRANTTKRGYNSRWQKARKHYLQQHPLCVMCQKEDKITKATVVDHIVPHRGDQTLFWDEGNWQALCKHHHDVKTMNEDKYCSYDFKF